MKYVLAHGPRPHVAVVDDGDYELVQEWRWYALRGPANPRNVYAFAKDGKQTIFMHRLILDAPSGIQVDHINRNGLDNRRTNLRLATNGLNRQNQRLRLDNRSGVRGVSWDASRGKWLARVHVGGKNRFQERFDSLDEATEAVIEARKRFMAYATD